MGEERLQSLRDFELDAVGGVPERERAIPAGATGVCSDRYGCQTVEEFAAQGEDERVGMVGGARVRSRKRATRRRRRNRKSRTVRSKVKRSVRR